VVHDVVHDVVHPAMWCTMWCTVWCTVWCSLWCTLWCTVWITEQKWKLCSFPSLPQPTCRKTGKKSGGSFGYSLSIGKYAELLNSYLPDAQP